MNDQEINIAIAKARGWTDTDNPRSEMIAHIGMSLRDWFAGQALAFYNAGVSGGMPWPAKQSVAKHAYQMADAMLAERNRKEEA